MIHLKFGGKYCLILVYHYVLSIVNYKLLDSPIMKENINIITARVSLLLTFENATSTVLHLSYMAYGKYVTKVKTSYIPLSLFTIWTVLVFNRFHLCIEQPSEIGGFKSLIEIRYSFAQSTTILKFVF